MRKGLTLSLVFVLLLGLLAACSESKDNASSNSTTQEETAQSDTTSDDSGKEEEVQPEKKPQSVTVLAVGETIEDSVDAVTGRAIIGLNSRFKEFRDNPANKHITVEFIETPWADMSNKVQTLNSDGSLDVMAGMGPYMPANKSTMHITDLYDRDIEELKAMYPESVWPYVQEWTKPGNEAVGLVQRMWPYVIAYDKKLFDDFGVPYLQEGYTAEQLLDTVTKLTGTNPKTGAKTYGMGVAANDGWKLNLIVQDLMAYYNPDPDQPYAANWGGNYFDSALDPQKYYNNGEVKVDISSGNKMKAFETAFALIANMPPGVANGEGMENWFTDNNNVGIWFYPEYGPYGAFVDPIISGDKSFFDRYGVVGSYKRPDTGRGGFANLTYVYMLSNAKVDDPERKEAVWSVMKYMAGFEYNKYYYLSNLEPSFQVGFETITYPGDLGAGAIMKHISTLEKLDPSITAPYDWTLVTEVAKKSAEQSATGVASLDEIHAFIMDQEQKYIEQVKKAWETINKQ